MTGEEIEMIARRAAELVVERLREEGAVAPAAPRLLSAADVAARIGRSRDFVYGHAADLGAVRLGDGPRARLGFDPRTVDEWVTRRRYGGTSNPAPTRSTTGTRRGRRPARSGKALDLLPVARSNPRPQSKRPRDVGAPGARPGGKS